jgi:hypothetical protein
LGNNQNLWIVDHFKAVGENVCQYSKDKLGKELVMGFGYAFLGKALEWYQVMWDHGGMGPVGKCFNGGTGGRGSVDLEKAADWHHEHQCYLSFTIDDHIMEFGSPTEIEEAIKKTCLDHKHMPKFGPSFKPTYWTPAANVDIAVKALKKYGRYE